MGFTSAKSKLVWGGTDYQCLRNYNWNGSVQEAVERCSGANGAVTHKDMGATDDAFNIDILVDSSTVVATLAALKRGQSDTFKFYPEEDDTGKLEFDAAVANINQSNMSGAVGTMNVLSLSIGIDGTLTIGAKA